MRFLDKGSTNWDTGLNLFPFLVFQRWLNSLQDHCAYSTHYTTMPHVVLLDELDEDYLPLGSMEDALKVDIIKILHNHCYLLLCIYVYMYVYIYVNIK